MSTCSKCSSSRLIPNVRIIDRAHGNSARDLSVEIYEDPEALIFKGTHIGTLAATICADCGHAELTVTNALDLYEVYQTSKRERSRTE